MSNNKNHLFFVEFELISQHSELHDYFFQFLVSIHAVQKLDFLRLVHQFKTAKEQFTRQQILLQLEKHYFKCFFSSHQQQIKQHIWRYLSQSQAHHIPQNLLADIEQDVILQLKYELFPRFLASDLWLNAVQQLGPSFLHMINKKEKDCKFMDISTERKKLFLDTVTAHPRYIVEKMYNIALDFCLPLPIFVPLEMCSWQ